MQKRTIHVLLITIVVGFMTLAAIRAMAIDTPVMTAEPKYTAGTSNTVAFTLPAEAAEIEVWQDSDADPSNGGIQSRASHDVPLPTQTTFSGFAGTLYYYYMRCKDSSGNWSGWSNVVSSTQDCEGPVFYEPIPDPYIWSNLSEKPAISVEPRDPAGIDPASIKMTLDGLPVNAVYDEVTGKIEYSPASPLADGVHTVEVSARDAAAAPDGPGLLGKEKSYSWTFKLDQQKPRNVGEITGPKVTNATLAFSWDYTPDNGDSGLSSYYLEIWTVGLGPSLRLYSETINAFLARQTWQLPPSIRPSDGNYRLQVWAVDKAGNRSEMPTTFDFTFDTTPPELSDLVVTCSQNSGLWDFAWQNAIDCQSKVAAYTVELWHDGSRTWGPALFSGTLFRLNDPISPGEYEFRVRAIDEAGNVSTTYASGILQAGTPLPPVAIDGPAYTGSTTPTFNVQTSLSDGSVLSGFYVEVCSLSGNLIQAFTTPVTDQITLPETALQQDGTYEVRIWTEGQDGERSPAYGRCLFIFDTTGPIPGPVKGPSATNNSQPDFKLTAIDDGSGIDHYEVTVMIGEIVVQGPSRVSEDGAFSPTAALSQEGCYRMMIRCVDRAGNAEGFEFDFIFDTTAPAPPEIVLPEYLTLAPTISWNPVRDNLTEVIYKVQLWHDGQLVWGRVTAKSSIILTPPLDLDDGPLELCVSAIDSAGNSSAPCRKSYILDNTQPEIVTVNGPAQTNDPRPTLTWTAGSDAGSGLAYYAVELHHFESGAWFRTIVPATGSAITWTVPAEMALPEDGLYFISVYSYDKAGNWSSPGQWDFTFDTTPPLPPTNCYGPSMINTYQLSFNWLPTQYDPTGIAKYLVQLFHEGESVWGPVEVGGYTAKLDELVALNGDGEYELQVWSVDGAGNISATNTSRKVLVDTTSPCSPESLQGPAFTRDGSPTFISAGGSDGGSGLKGYFVEVHAQSGETVQSFLTSQGETEWTFPTALTQEGQYEVRVWTQDIAGNRSVTCKSQSLVFDRTAPLMVGPIDGPKATGNNQPTFTWPAGSDGGSGVDHYLVRIKLGTEQHFPPYVVPAKEGTVTWTVPSQYDLWTEGDFTIEVQCLDRAGNESSVITFQFTFDGTPPSYPDTFSVPYWTNSRTIPVSWMPPSGEATKVVSYSVEVWLNGTVVWGPVQMSGESVTVSVPEDGCYEFRLWSIDEAGNISTSCTKRTCNVDTVAPDPPSKIEGPAYTNTGTPSFFCSGPLDGYWGYRVEVYSQVGEMVQTFTSGDRKLVIPKALAEEGQYEVRAWSIDPAGNKSAAFVSATFIFDATVPDAPIVNGPAYTKDGTPSFNCSGPVDNGSGLAGYYVEVRKQSGELLESFEPAGTEWTIPTFLVQDGTYEVRVWANDKAGNRSRTYTSFPFVLDTVAPTLSGTIQGPTVTNSTRPTFTLPAGSDGASGVDHYGVILYDGPNPQYFTVPASSGTVTWTVPEGVLEQNHSYSIRVYCLDRAGNSSCGRLENGGYVEFGFTLDNIGPIVTILTPASGGTYTINESSSLWARASECASAQVRVDGGEWTNVTKVMADGSIFHFFAVPLSPGLHTIDLKVLDSAGNETIVSITITVSGQRKGFGFGRFSFPGYGQ